MKINEYLKIGEASRLVGVTKKTLRNWENAKKIKKVRRDVGGHRLYLKEDLEELLKKIYEQQKLKEE